MNEPEIAFLDQVQKWQAAIDIAARDLDDESQIALDHAVAGRLIAFLDAAGEFDLLGGRQEWRYADLVQIQAGWIGTMIPPGRRPASGGFTRI
jgi:hypothetical protein